MISLTTPDYCADCGKEVSARMETKDNIYCEECWYKRFGVERPEDSVQQPDCNIYALQRADVAEIINEMNYHRLQAGETPIPRRFFTEDMEHSIQKGIEYAFGELWWEIVKTAIQNALDEYNIPEQVKCKCGGEIFRRTASGCALVKILKESDMVTTDEALKPFITRYSYECHNCGAKLDME